MRVLPEVLVRAKKVAQENWCEWRHDFEFSGDQAQMPVLADSCPFLRFCWDYSLLRNSKSQTVERVRVALFDKDIFRSAIADNTGQTLEKLAHELKSLVPEIRSTERSLLSKLAAFAKPDTFVAWDKFARWGSYYLSHGSQSDDPYPTYGAYIKEVRTIWDGELGNQIRDFLKPCDSPWNTTGFAWRVLDCCMMIAGGRVALLRD